MLLTVSWASDDSLENTGWIRFTVKEICNDWAKLQWEPVLEKFSISQRPPRFTSCEISYMNLHTQEARLVMVVPDSKVNWLKLGKLEESTHYMASMTCNNTFTSATIHFVTGMLQYYLQVWNTVFEIKKIFRNIKAVYCICINSIKYMYL